MLPVGAYAISGVLARSPCLSGQDNLAIFGFTTSDLICVKVIIDVTSWSVVDSFNSSSLRTAHLVIDNQLYFFKTVSSNVIQLMVMDLHNTSDVKATGFTLSGTDIIMVRNHENYIAGVIDGPGIKSKVGNRCREGSFVDHLFDFVETTSGCLHKIKQMINE